MKCTFKAIALASAVTVVVLGLGLVAFHTVVEFQDRMA